MNLYSLGTREVTAFQETGTEEMGGTEPTSRAII